ncbi:MAG: hypothetical protein ACJAYE_000774 [Candidatus Azotimanducaceae bacterium]|jgi:hypothetical protein
MDYQLFHLKDRASSNPLRLINQIQSLRDSNSWGVFPSLFGLGSNELYWVVMTTANECPLQADDVEVLGQTTLQSTVRPVAHIPRHKSGIYVYRWFEVAAEHVDEVVRLSGEAWETFEDGFDTEVQGLFTASPTMPVGYASCGMLLVTWYRDLGVWQASRTPNPEATKRFVARQALLDSAVPIATRLVVEDA